MLSRRRFIQAGTMASGAALATHPAFAEEKCAPLPPSIAGLKSMKDHAMPITRDERRDREEKARRLMQASNLDAILLMEGTSLSYFTGIQWHGGERLFAMVLPAKGMAFYVCPAFEEGRAREQIANAPEGDQGDVRVWQEDESPYQRLAQGFKDRGIATGSIGMEETARFVFTEGIAKAAGQVKIASATPVTAGCRMIKSDHEIALMRLASKVTLAAYEAAYHALNEGMTQQQFEGLIEAAARKVITDAGYGPDYKFFTHRLGHGMGMDGHEWPYLVRGNATKLAPNMTFSDEPGIYLRGEFGIRLEDDMHITENGAELFTPQSTSLEHPFG